MTERLRKWCWWGAIGWLLALSGMMLAGGGRGVPVRRIVSMAPALTEICFAVGAGDRLVGVTDFCTYPPAAALLPRAGGFLNPNLERILTLQPDLVLLVPDERELKGQLDNLGVPTLVVPVYTMEDIFRAIVSVGTAAGCEPGGRAVAAALKEALGKLSREIPAAPRPGVMLVVGRNFGELANIYAAGRRTFLNELLEFAGGRNVYEGSLVYPTLSMEGIAALAPEVIIELYPGLGMSAAQKKALAGDWNRVPFLPAVRDRRVFVLDDSYLSIPGPRLVEIVKRFKTCLWSR